MIHLSLISDALAQAEPAQKPNVLLQMLPLGVLIVVFYFLLIRPQMRRSRQHRDMITQLKVGDEVITSGGMLGIVREIGDNFIALEIGEKTAIKVQKSAVNTLVPKGTMKNL